MLATLKEALVQDVGRYTNRLKAHEYQEAFKRTLDPNYRELANIYRYLARGKKLISINKAMQIAGVKADGSPVLAIANASAKWCWFKFDGGYDADYNFVSSFCSDWRKNPGSHWKATKATWVTRFRFPRTFFPIRPRQSELKARVPLVPPQHLPRGDLSRYCILWEADWNKPPVDPLLLQRISREFFVVHAEWNLSPVERLVLETAAFSGD